MASSINFSAYSDALVVLATAGVAVPVLRRWNVSPIIGYLFGGALLGPLGLGSFIGAVPALYWVTIVDARDVGGIAELGIVFLLFLIGLELSWKRLMTMRRLVFGLGGLQVIVSGAGLAAAVAWSGQGAAAAVILGSCLALSSTAVVIEILSGQGRLATAPGRASFAVLLAQDLAVVPILLFISILGGDSTGSVWRTLAIALGQAMLALALIVVAGRALLRPLFRIVVAARSSELFIAAILFVIIGSGVVAALAGLSMALGAFVAGLLLAETEYRKAIEAIVEPFKGLLLGLFFFTVGMNIDVRELLRDPARLLACVAALVALKAVLLIALGKMFRLSWVAAVETGLLLGPGGEFAFVGVGMAGALHLLARETASFTLAVVSLTMMLIPLLSGVARRLTAFAAARRPVDPELLVAPAAEGKRAIVVGYGRVGKVVCALLRARGIAYVASDASAASVSRDRKDGHEVYYGDSADPLFLRACGLERASAVIITVDDLPTVDSLVRHVRDARPDIPIVCRARDAGHARHLYEIGVTDAVPETVEASLQLSQATLVALGVPMGLAIAAIHEKRDEFRDALRKAAAARAT